MTRPGDYVGGDGGKGLSATAFFNFFSIFSEAHRPQTTLYTIGAHAFIKRTKNLLRRHRAPAMCKLKLF